MSPPREALVALAEAVRVLYRAPRPLAALREVLPLLATMLGATEAAMDEWPCNDLRPTAPCIRLASWMPTARSGGEAKVRPEEAPVIWEMFCPMGRTDELGVGLRQGTEARGLSFRRAEGFGEGETRLLELFLEHVTVGSGGVDSRTGEAVRSGGEWALRVSTAGELGPVEPELATRLRRYWPRGDSAVPVELKQWVAVERGRWRRESAPELGPAWYVAQPWGRLRLQLEPEPAGAAVLRGWEEQGATDFRRLRARGLTERECEVVFWLAQGKRDAEIATILAAAPKTIGKHVEHVLAKLGAESRGAALVTAREWLERTVG